MIKVRCVLCGVNSVYMLFLKYIYFLSDLNWNDNIGRSSEFSQWSFYIMPMGSLEMTVNIINN